MRNRFDRQMEELHTALIEMGALCEHVIGESFQALMSGDMEAASKIIGQDAAIDLKEREIETLCLKLLLQQQPVASDLRKVSAALKMITDMERIGDQASDIAEIVRTAGDLRAPAQTVQIGEMAQAASKMVTASIDAYVKQDLAIAQQVIADDDDVDRLFDLIRDELAHGIGKGVASVEQTMDILMIAKYFERIGDHATNIAEWVEFSITGHHRGEETE